MTLRQMQVAGKELMFYTITCQRQQHYMQEDDKKATLHNVMLCLVR